MIYGYHVNKILSQQLVNSKITEIEVNKRPDDIHRNTKKTSPPKKKVTSKHEVKSRSLALRKETNQQEKVDTSKHEATPTLTELPPEPSTIFSPFL